MGLKVRLTTFKHHKFADITVTSDNPTFANALRRHLLNDVGGFAIASVIFVANDSFVPDEIMAHRLGMLPLIVTGLNRSVSIDVTAHKHRVVTTADIKGEDVSFRLDRDVQLTTLKKGESLQLTASITHGTPETHARHASVNLVTWKPDIKLTINVSTLSCKRCALLTSMMYMQQTGHREDSNELGGSGSNFRRMSVWSTVEDAGYRRRQQMYGMSRLCP